MEREVELEAAVLAKALRARFEVAVFGFGATPHVRFTFDLLDGDVFNFDMPAKGPHWDAFVRLAQEVEQSRQSMQKSVEEIDRLIACAMGE